MPAPWGSCCPRSSLKVARSRASGHGKSELEGPLRGQAEGGKDPRVCVLPPVASHLQWAPGSSSVPAS